MLRASVIIASAPGDDVDRCLAGLERQERGTPEFEILVVPTAGGSTETSARDLRVRVLPGVGEGPAPAWNAGADAAQGDRVIFLAGHLQPLPWLVTRHVEAGTGGLLVAGPVEPGQLPERATLLDCAEATISVGRERFGSAGGFDDALRWGAPIELAHRLAVQGVGFRRIPHPVARRDPRSNRQEEEARADAGQGSVALYRHTPALLPVLELGAFNAAGPAAVRLRRAALALGAPRVPDLEPLLPGGKWLDRWRRFVHGYHYWRGAMSRIPERTTRQALVRAPVILMYHAVGRTGEPAGWYTVPGRRFAHQMAWLARRRYRILSLPELLEHRRRFELPPARSVVITFDDGYADNYEVAYPILRAHGFPATFFLVSGCIGAKNTWDTGGELGGRAMVSWGAARELVQGGMDVGAHTRRHQVLPGLSPGEVADELSGGRRDLETGLGRPVDTFAYPFGRLDEATTAAVARAGYIAACCSRSGRNDPAVPELLLRRVEVRGTDPLWRFALAVHGGRTIRRRRRA